MAADQMKRKVIACGLVLLLCGVATAGMKDRGLRKPRLPEQHGKVPRAAFLAQTRALGYALIPEKTDAEPPIEAVTVTSRFGKAHRYWTADVVSSNFDRNVHIVYDADRASLDGVTMVDRRAESSSGAPMGPVEAAWATSHWIRTLPLLPLTPDAEVAPQWRPVRKPHCVDRLWQQIYQAGYRRALVSVDAATGGLRVLRFWDVRDSKTTADDAVIGHPRKW